jgi:hypothetical protein
MQSAINVTPNENQTPSPQLPPAPEPLPTFTAADLEAEALAELKPPPEVMAAASNVKEDENE